jgi:multidrug efflux system outer membrane protein
VKRVTLFLTALAVAGCTMGPDYKRPVVPEPEHYREVDLSTIESIADIPWWEMFGDTVLVALIDSALVNNRDLRAAVARITEARAALGIVRSQLFPRLDYGADGAYSGTLGEDGKADGTGSAFLAASWQVDLWGRIRRSKEAALQELLATEEAYRGVTISLVAGVASSYMLLRDLDNRLDISEKTLDLWNQRLDVVQTRFDAGMVNEVDLNQAQIQVYEAEVQVQTFKRLRTQTENAISVLIGEPPDEIARGLELTDQVLAPDIPAGLPSDLLRRRPDILQAERQLAAQTARIGAAKALRFPQFDLTADLGAQFNGGSTGIFGLGAQLFGPIYNAGEISNQIEAEIARTEQLLNRYEQTILNAYREVDDALVSVSTYRAELDARRRKLAAAQNAAELSWTRYEGGLTSYLEVLDLQRSWFTARLQASETYQLELTAIIGLYQALGGGWVAEQDSTGLTADLAPREQP